MSFNPLQIGSYTIIGSNSIIKAYQIGYCVRIGKDCIVMDNVNIGNNSIILDNSIVPEDTNIPDNCVFGGRPAKFIRITPFNTKQKHILEAINYYDHAMNYYSTAQAIKAWDAV